MTRAALQDLGLDAKSMDRCKNFFALGMCYWLYNRLDGLDLHVARRQVREQAAAGRGQQARDEGRLHLLRSHRGLPDQLRDSAGQADARHVPQHQRQPGAGPGLRGRLAEGRPAALPGLLSDHAGLRHPARALDVQEVRRDDVPGRRRDRGDHLGDRRGLRRRAGHHHHLRARAWRSRPKRSAWRSPSSCRS